VPLTSIQLEILQLLAANRDPESYVAGSTPLNRFAPRISKDIDVFHDREVRVALSAHQDAKTLQASGFTVEWLRQLPLVYAAKISRATEITLLEWVADSDFRFFPTQPDRIFGFLLHPVDLAINKLMAAVGRSEVRDLVDLLWAHENILSLSALTWAAVEKSPGFTPEGLLAELRRNSNYPASDWRSLNSETPIDPIDTTQRLRAAITLAEAFVSRMPTSHVGLLFLQNQQAVEPDPNHLDAYTPHAAVRQGHWPANPQISSAMFQLYKKPTTEK
jgi:hypothetical protein